MNLAERLVRFACNCPEEYRGQVSPTPGREVERGFGITIETEYPVALDSPDHLLTLRQDQGGSTVDNSRNREFTENLYKQFPDRKISVLDLGCSGGGFCLDVLMDYHFAVGLEGSDYCLKHQRASWSKAPHCLFTCDVSRPFRVLRFGSPVLFDVITSWEMIEHIPEERLPFLFDNIKRHLAPGGFFIGSISPVYGPPYHQTVAPRSWWEPLWASHKFTLRPDIVRRFGSQFVRGPDNNADRSFIIAVSAEEST